MADRIETFQPETRRMHDTPDSMAEAVRDLSSGLSSLVRGHMALARTELKNDLKALGKDAAIMSAGTPMLLTGYLLLWMAVGFLLALAVAAWLAFAICAAANFLIGGGLMLWGRSRAKRDKVDLPVTKEEVNRDRAWLPTLKQQPEPIRGQIH